MAKRNYTRRESGLILPGDSLALPWYARRDRRWPPEWKKWSRRRCCCGTLGPCTGCSEGTVPAEYSLTLADWPCGGNQEYILTKTASSPSCVWVWLGTSPWARLDVNTFSTDRVLAHLYPSGTCWGDGKGYSFMKLHDDPAACNEFDFDMDYDALSSVPVCNTCDPRGTVWLKAV